MRSGNEASLRGAASRPVCDDSRVSTDNPKNPSLPIDVGANAYDASADAPTRLTYAERKQARFQMRVEKWEDRMAGPPPPRYLHRAIVTIAMMGAMLLLLYILLFAGPPA